MKKSYYVYILTNWKHTVLYIGVTNNIQRRVYEHKNAVREGFTKRYRIKYLMLLEVFSNAYSAISREKQLKKWSRKKKETLISLTNPDWQEIKL